MSAAPRSLQCDLTRRQTFDHLLSPAQEAVSHFFPRWMVSFFMVRTEPLIGYCAEATEQEGIVRNMRRESVPSALCSMTLGFSG